MRISTLSYVYIYIYLYRKFSKWCFVTFELHADGFLCYKKRYLSTDTQNYKEPLLQKIDLKSITKLRIKKVMISPSFNEVAIQLRGLVLHRQVWYRLIMHSAEIRKFYRLLKSLIPVLDDDEFLAEMNWGSLRKKIVRNSLRAEIPYLHELEVKEIATSMDMSATLAMKKAIQSRRRAFSLLPVRFTSDLIHGSWWYLWSALLGLVITIVVLADAYIPSESLGSDDSILPPDQFRLAWGLCFGSSLGFLIGSVAFIRACNDPPLPPIFKWRHFQTDELFGGWMIAVAIFPAIPYVFIYLSASPASSFYFFAFVVVVCVFFAAIIFVKLLYPKSIKNETDNHVLLWIQLHWHIIGSIFACTYLCPTKKWTRLNFFEVHCATDWTVACWTIFYGTAGGLAMFTAYFVYELVYNRVNRLTIFVDITRYNVNKLTY
jgi:hypothetical protein